MLKNIILAAYDFLCESCENAGERFYNLPQAVRLTDEGEAIRKEIEADFDYCFKVRNDFIDATNPIDSEMMKLLA